MDAKEMPNDNDFNSAFWSDDFDVDLEGLVGPLCVAQMTQANQHVPADPKQFYENAVSIADKFMELMARVDTA
jgi:hypothetical protein